jgi:hypothetical protein
MRGTLTLNLVYNKLLSANFCLVEGNPQQKTRSRRKTKYNISMHIYFGV